MGFTLYQVGIFKNCPSKMYIEKNGVSVRDVLIDLEKQYTCMVNLFQENQLNSELFILINGININLLKCLDTSIKAGSDLHIFAKVSGG